MKFRLANSAPILLALLCGCASSRHATTIAPGVHEPMLARGDWNDVNASVEAAVSKVEMTVLQADDGPGPDTKVFTLLAITNEPGLLTVRRRTTPDADARTENLQLEATIGRLGDPGREQALMAAVRKRLGQLAGVDFAPLK